VIGRGKREEGRGKKEDHDEGGDDGQGGVG